MKTTYKIKFLLTILLTTLLLSGCGLDKIIEKTTSSMLFGSSGASSSSNGDATSNTSTPSTGSTGTGGVIDSNSCSTKSTADDCFNDKSTDLGVTIDPSSGEINVPISSVITVDFTTLTMTLSEAQINLFLLEKSTTSSGIVSYSKINATVTKNNSTFRSFTITPSSQFKNSTNYVVIVDTQKRGATFAQFFATSINESDLDSIRGTQGVASSLFTTVSGGSNGNNNDNSNTHTIQFSVSSTIPANSATNVETNSTISFTINKTTVTAETMRTNIVLMKVSDYNAGNYANIVTGNLAVGTISGSNKTFVFTPSAALEAGQPYLFAINKYLTGQNVPADFSTAATFTTKTNTPTTRTTLFNVISTQPINNASNVEINASIDFTIDKNNLSASTLNLNVVLIKASDYNSGNYQNIVYGSVIAGSISGSNQTFTFDPQDKLEGGEIEYVFAVNKYLTGSTASDYEIITRFKTKIIPTERSLEFEVVSPTTTIENAEVNAPINFTINKNTISASALQANIIMIKASDYNAGNYQNIVYGTVATVSTSGTNQTFKFTPSSALTAGQIEYYLVFNRYLTGQSAPSDFNYKISIKTKATTTRTTQFETSFTQPTSNAENVDLKSTITFSINKTNISATTLSSNIVLIKESDLQAGNYQNLLPGKLVAGAISGSNQTFTFTPEASFTGSTRYVFAINRYLSGQTTPADFDLSITFTTKADTGEIREYIPCSFIPAQSGSERTKLFYDHGTYYASIIINSSNPSDHTFNSPLTSNRTYMTDDKRYCLFDVINDQQGNQMIVNERLHPFYLLLLGNSNSNTSNTGSTGN